MSGIARGSLGIALLTAVALLVSALGPSQPASAAGPAFPRLAVVYYADPWSQIDRLARFDLWIGANDATTRDALRARNPAIKLIPYQISTESCGKDGPRNDAGTRVAGFDPVWWLQSSSGQVYQFWRDCPMVNPSAAAPVVDGLRFNQFFANYVRDYVWNPGQGRYDGLYLDNLWEIIAWKAVDYGNDIDLDRNGANDLIEHGSAWVDRQWGDGVRDMVRQIRAFVGPDAILIGGTALTMDSTNGRVWEDWPNGWDPQFSPVYGFNSWRAAFENYRQWQRMHYGDFAYVILTYPQGSDPYRNIRFGLASTLLGDGYFAPGDNVSTNASLNWYDEFSVDLTTGRATGDASRKGYLGQPQGDATDLGNGVWRRDYDNGIVVLNTTSEPQTVALGGSFRRILGTQAPSVNNGATETVVDLPPNDGLILLRPVDAIATPTTAVPGSSATATSTPTKSSAADDNLIVNSGFEEGTDGWLGWQSTISQITGGHSGNAALRMTLQPGATSMAVSNWPGAVPNPAPGESFVASAWVRGEGSSVGKTAWLILREHSADGSAQHAEYSTPQPLTAGWTQLTVRKTTTLPNAANMDVLVQIDGATDGDQVDVDDVVMRRATNDPSTATPAPAAATPAPAGADTPAAGPFATPTATSAVGGGPGGSRAVLQSYLPVLVGGGPET